MEAGQLGPGLAAAGGRRLDRGRHRRLRRHPAPLGPRGREVALVERLPKPEDRRVVLLTFERGHLGLGDLAQGLGRPEQARRPNPVAPRQRHERERLELVGDRAAVPAPLPAADRLAVLGLGLVDPAVASQGVTELALGGELEPVVVDGVELGLGLRGTTAALRRAGRPCWRRGRGPG